MPLAINAKDVSCKRTTTPGFSLVDLQYSYTCLGLTVGLLYSPEDFRMSL